MVTELDPQIALLLEVEGEPSSDRQGWRWVRAVRDGMLRESDWTQLPDAPDADRDGWAVYRQALRDLTDGVESWRDVTFPVPPDA